MLRRPKRYQRTGPVDRTQPGIVGNVLADIDWEGKAMNPLFQQDSFVIKRKKLSTDKLRVFSSNGDFLMYAENKIKWKPPFTAAVHVYADEQKLQEILVATDAGGHEYDNFLEVKDLVSGESVGGIGFDMNLVKDGWKIMDASGAVLAAIKEKSFGRSIIRLFSRGMVAQKMLITMGDHTVGTMNQKHAMVGNRLHIDLTQEGSSKLDHRLVVAAGVFIAAYQAKEDLD